VILKALNPVMANDEPQFQRAKSPAERNLPIPIIENRSRLGGFVPQILRKDAESLDQSLAIRDIKAVAIEIGEHPLMRIERVAVRKFYSVVRVAELRAQRGCPRHRSVNVEPKVILLADTADFGKRIDCVRGRRPDRRAHETRNQTCFTVRFYLARQRIGTHGESFIYVD